MVEETTGNPLAWPASLPFAACYHVPPSLYDRMAPFSITWESVPDLALLRNELRADSAAHAPYFIEGFSAPQMQFGRVARQVCPGGGRLVFPLFRSNLTAVVVVSYVGSPANSLRELVWNGARYPINQAAEGGWASTRIPVGRGVAQKGSNELVLVSADDSGWFERLIFEREPTQQHVPGNYPP